MASPLTTLLTHYLSRRHQKATKPSSQPAAVEHVTAEVAAQQAAIAHLDQPAVAAAAQETQTSRSLRVATPHRVATEAAAGGAQVVRAAWVG